MTVAALAALLHETAEHHDRYERIAAARLVGLVRGLHGRPQGGSSPGESSSAADRYMAEVSTSSCRPRELVFSAENPAHPGRGLR